MSSPVFGQNERTQAQPVTHLMKEELGPGEKREPEREKKSF